MSSKKKSVPKNIRGNAEQIFAMKRFYMKLPDEAIDFAVSKLSREVRRKSGKDSDKEKQILTALTMSPLIFTESVYDYLKGGIMLAESSAYDEIIASYNSENCLMNTVFILKKCCDGSFDSKILEEFVDSEEFRKTLSGEYGDYIEDEENSEDKPVSESPPPPVAESPKNIVTAVKTVSRAEKRKSKEKVTYYIGNIEKRSSFYNFRPQYTIEIGKSVKKLEELYQLTEKFPRFGCINISYSKNKRSQEVLDELDLKMVYAINCADIIEPNFVSEGVLHEIEMKVDLQKEFDSKRNSTSFFRKISDFRIFRIVKPDEYIPDSVLFRDEIEISDDFSQDELVLLHRIEDSRMPSDSDDISGPYKVDKKNGKTFIQPKVAEERYLLNCYEEKKLSFGAVEEQKLGENPVSKEFAVITDNSNYKKDIISDDILIKNMLADVSEDINDVDELVKTCRSSVFLAENLPDTVKEKRRARVFRLFADIVNYSDEQREIAKRIIRAYSSEDDEIKALVSEMIRESDEFKKLKAELENEKAKSAEEAKPETVYIRDESQIDEKNREIERLEKKISELEEKCVNASACDSITQEIANQKNIMKYLAGENFRLERINEELKEKIKTTIQEKTSDIGIAFDPYISNAMLEAVGEWNRKQEAEIYSRIAVHNAEKASECPHMDRAELCGYLTDYVRQYRNYSKNDILNMYICIAQGFLTVFSGLSGTGKTSICNIIGCSLGLDSFGGVSNAKNISSNRFVSVSVEKGWSSKRDLIGYYNPLTQKYDKSNRRLYDSLMILSEEKDNSAFPYVVLLDEANLSPMEYYWADFMQVADRSETGKSFINIGVDNEIYIPDTLRFVATVNNDQTTETLSPRLLDRAWIIKLPEIEIKKETAVKSETVLWSDFVSAFDSGEGISTEAESLLNRITGLFRTHGMPVSPRIQLSIRRYIASARDIMESVNGTAPEYVAVDYAVMQKLLPKICGHVKIYRNFFDELLEICTANGLEMTKNAVEEMQENSSRNMGYCRYLS